MTGDALNKVVQHLDCTLKPCFPRATGLSRPGKEDSLEARKVSVLFKAFQVSPEVYPSLRTTKL